MGCGRGDTDIERPEGKKERPAESGTQTDLRDPDRATEIQEDGECGLSDSPSPRHTGRPRSGPQTGEQKEDEDPDH